MPFVNPNILAQIFGPEGSINTASPQAKNTLINTLAGVGSGMTRAAAQPGATFGQALGGGAQGLLQGQAAAQQYQMQQMQMQQMQRNMERQERLSKIMGDILNPRTDFASQVDARLPQVPQIDNAIATPYTGGPAAMTARYESSGSPTTVSSGLGDPGGRSYGPFQLSSNTGTMSKFLQSPEGQPFAGPFQGLDPSSEQFAQRFQQVASQAGPDFERAQRQYLERTHVLPVMVEASKAGLPVNNPAIQAALYSQATQHSGDGNVQILNETMARVSPDSTPEDILETLYDVRERYATAALQRNGASPDVIQGVQNRYRQERQDTRGLLGERQVGGGVLSADASTQGAEPPLNGYQQQAPSQMAGLPAETRQLLALMDPEDALKAMVDMQQQADLPAEVDALRWLTGDDDKARALYAQKLQREATDKPDQRARKISDYQSLYGFSRGQSVKIADGLADFELNPNTGRVIYTDFTTGDVTEITPRRAVEEKEPELSGPTLWEVAEKGNPTGLGSGVAEISNRALGQVGVEVGSDTVAQRRYFSNATQDFIRALALNERFPVQEMERIRREVNLEPSVFADESTFKASMRSLDSTLRDRIDYYKWAAGDPSSPQDLRESFESAARQMEWFLKRLGVPQGSGGTGDSSAPEGWENDWQYLTPEERQEVLGGQ